MGTTQNSVHQGTVLAKNESAGTVDHSTGALSLFGGTSALDILSAQGGQLKRQKTHSGTGTMMVLFADNGVTAFVLEY